MKRGVLLIYLLLQTPLALAAASPLSIGKNNYLSTCSPLDITGYVDTSYNYLLHSNQFISGAFNRSNDITENGFTLQQAALTFSVIPVSGFGGTLNVIAGQDAYSVSPYGLNPNVIKSNDIGVAIPEAYGLYAYQQYILYVGEMLSLSGIEQFDYGLDANFSRSILDQYAQPGTHVGIRLADQWSSTWRVLGGINNGWSTVKQAGILDTAEFGLQYTTDQLNAVIDGYVGRQHLDDASTSGPYTNRYLIDAYGTYFLTKKLSVAMNYDYGLQVKAALPNDEVGRANWQAIALYSTYYWTDLWRSTIRGEVFDDNDGSRTGVRQNWKEITLTLAYDMTKHLMLRAETRHDFTNANAILYKGSMHATNNQQSYALEAYYSFAIS